MNKIAAYKFLRQLVEKYPSDAVPMLQDIIVDYLLFPHGDGVESPPSASLTEMDQEVARLMAEGKKIHAVKLVRDRLGVDLKAAKDYVEQRAWPASAKVSEKAQEMQAHYVKTILDKIRKDYNVLEE
jgi:hypothetical protein